MFDMWPSANFSQQSYLPLAPSRFLSLSSTPINLFLHFPRSKACTQFTTIIRKSVHPPRQHLRQRGFCYRVLSDWNLFCCRVGCSVSGTTGPAPRPQPTPQARGFGEGEGRKALAIHDLSSFRAQVHVGKNSSKKRRREFQRGGGHQFCDELLGAHSLCLS